MTTRSTAPVHQPNHILTPNPPTSAAHPASEPGDNPHAPLAHSLPMKCLAFPVRGVRCVRIG